MIGPTRTHLVVFSIVMSSNSLRLYCRLVTGCFTATVPVGDVPPTVLTSAWLCLIMPQRCAVCALMASSARPAPGSSRPLEHRNTSRLNLELCACTLQCRCDLSITPLELSKYVLTHSGPPFGPHTDGTCKLTVRLSMVNSKTLPSTLCPSPFALYSSHSELVT